MFYCKVESLAVVTVSDPRNLLAAWKAYGHLDLVGAYKCATPLSHAERSALPAELRERVVEA